MGRYTGAKCRLCRREGVKLFLKGDRCYSGRCAATRRPTPPGQHGRFRRRPTQFSIHLREKQKAKRMYGVREAQFRGYVEAAKRWKGVTGEALLRYLESRLDNTLYRAGFASSRDKARQLVNHGHFQVNGRHTNIPSYLVQEGDVVEVKPESRDKLRESVKAAAERRPLPVWLTRDLEGLRVQATGVPNLEELDQAIEVNLIVEFYSR